MTERDGAIGSTLSLLRDRMPQQALADAMRAKGHRWSQSTVWGVEKGERPLRLSEAADLAEILDVSIYELLKLPYELGLQGEIVDQCSVIEAIYGDAVWAMYELDAAHEALEARLIEADQKGIQVTLIDAASVEGIKRLTAATAVHEAKVLQELDPDDRPETRDDAVMMLRRRRRG